MITAVDGAWRYLGPPRTGSTTIHKVLQGRPWYGIVSVDQHEMSPLADAQILVSVRNPFSRALSLWRHYRYDLNRPKWSPDTGPTAATEEEYPFRRFLQEAIEDQVLGKFFGETISGWLQDIPEVHRVIRQESLWEDLRASFPEYADDSVWDQVVHTNLSRRAFIRRHPYADAECVRIVTEWAKEDFLRWDYSRAVPTELGVTL